jgi:hypothetical protein
MIKLSPQEMRTLKIGVGFFVLFAIFWWGVIPAWNTYDQLHAELEKAKSTYAHVSKNVGTEAEFKNRYEAYADAYETLKGRYYSNINEKDAMLQFLTLVEELTEGTGVTILSKTTGLDEDQKFRVLKVNLTLKGTADHLTDLLLAFKSSETVIRVDRLRIDRDEREDILQIKVTVSTLIIQEEGVSNVAKPQS